MKDINLEQKLVSNITGEFIIPSYQRGYRWGKKEVQLLVKDILNNSDKKYCLQPIVVKKLREGNDKISAQYELIDGQQRLTSLYLIYKAISELMKRSLPNIKFVYTTRKETWDFICNLSKDIAHPKDELKYVDFWYIAQAYRTIHDLLKEDEDNAYELSKALNRYVSVIWYEIPCEGEEARNLFQRLNIGQIKLTAAELVKALFLRQHDKQDDSAYTGKYSVIHLNQEEISLQWDSMERELHNENLWAFLTTTDHKEYSTRIDLVLDLMAGKSGDARDPLSTFFVFDDIYRQKVQEKQKEDSSADVKGLILYDTWQAIQVTFLMLKDWYRDHDLYHQIGYLITSKQFTLLDIYKVANGKKKSEFKQAITTLIKKSIQLKNEPATSDNILELTYQSDHQLLERILLLYNIETMRSKPQLWFPFAHFKATPENNKKLIWSLEHIHAQQSETLNTNEARRKWLEDHISSVKCLIRKDGNSEEECTNWQELLEKMTKMIAELQKTNTKTIGDDFQEIQKIVWKGLSEGDEDIYIQTIHNLALLDVGNNAALSNYVFDAKRNHIIKLDKQGTYIPYCTRMVFFKYYTPSELLQVYYWSEEDREQYVENIISTLQIYLN